MSVKEKSSVYEQPSIYNQGGGGGPVGPKLIYKMNFNNEQAGWRFGYKSVLSVPYNASTKFAIITNDSCYNFTPNLSSSNKLIEFTFAFNKVTGQNGNYRLWGTKFDRTLFAGVYNNGWVRVSLYDSTIHEKYYWANAFFVNLNKDYLIYNKLDIENGKYYLYVNDSKIIDSSVDIAQLTLNSWRPAWGSEPNYNSAELPGDFKFYRDKVSYKIDGAEVLAKENLE